MIPKPPPREGALGFLYLPPYRVQGLSVAGEATAVQVPELDIGFDMGACPRPLLSSKMLALSHGHMDHCGAVAYWCSQRVFQGMGPGTIACDARIAPALKRMMDGYRDLEQQDTPYDIKPLADGQEIPLKANLVLRGFHTEHTCPSMGFSVVEKRSKLREDLVGLPQEKLCELKDRGETITRIVEIPLVAYLGDTLPGPWLVRDDVRRAQVVICECTFIEQDHQQRARIGKHIHIDDIAEWLPVLECDALVLTHLSRRTHLGVARKLLRDRVKGDKADRVHFLMDFRENRTRYERQEAEVAALAAEPAAPRGA